MLHALILAAASKPQMPCNRDPSPISMAQPALPQGFRVRGKAQRAATVAVILDTTGKVTGVSIYKSSGDAVMDRAALDAARRSTFAPGAANCMPVGGTFAVDFSFDGNAKTPSCPAQAGVVRPVVPDTAGLQFPPIRVTVSMLVTIGADGEIKEARIIESSGVMQLDQAALRAARESTYRAKLIAVRRQASATSSGETLCEPVTGTYIFKVTFEPNR